MAQESYRKSILDNGVRVLTEQVSGVRSVSAGIWVHSGSRDEDIEEQGISHLLEHMLFKGTSTRTVLDIAKELDTLGGFSNAFTAKEHTCFHAKVLDSDLEQALDLLLDMFVDSRFDPTDLELEKAVVLQEIGMMEDTPEEYVHVLFNEAFWDGNPLGRSILGKRETIPLMNRDRILEYVQRMYVPGNTLIAAAGNVTHEGFLRLLGNTLRDRPASKPPKRDLGLNFQKVSTFTPRDLEQVHVCLGTPGPSSGDQSRYADTLLNVILGGNMSSRLFQEIREKRGLAYSVYSFLNTYQDAGLLGIYLAVAPESLEEALELTAGEFARLRAGDLSEADLSAAKQYLKGSILLGAENTDNRMMRMAKNEFAFERFIPYTELEQRIGAVTLDEIFAVADLRLDSERISLTVLGPLNGPPSFPS